MPQLDIFVLYSQVFTTSLFFIISYILLTKRYLVRIVTTLKFRFWKTWVTHRHCAVISQFYRKNNRHYTWRSVIFNCKLFKRLSKLNKETTRTLLTEFAYVRSKYVNTTTSIVGFLKRRIFLETAKIKN